MIKSFLFVGLGGLMGSMARYGVHLLLQRWSTSFPWGTFSANLLGCLLIGMVMGWFLKGSLDDGIRLLVVVGFLRRLYHLFCF